MVLNFIHQCKVILTCNIFLLQVCFNAEYALNELFSENVLAYSRLSSYSFESLAYRSIVLGRIAQVLDSALHLVTGPSVLEEQNLCSNKYGLESFTESSFISSCQSLDAGETSNPFPRSTDEEVITSHLDEEVTMSQQNTVDDPVKDEKNHCFGRAHAKRTKSSLASLEKLHEQLKAVRRKVRVRK